MSAITYSGQWGYNGPAFTVWQDDQQGWIYSSADWVYGGFLEAPTPPTYLLLNYQAMFSSPDDMVLGKSVLAPNYCQSVSYPMYVAYTLELKTESALLTETAPPCSPYQHPKVNTMYAMNYSVAVSDPQVLSASAESVYQSAPEPHLMGLLILVAILMALLANYLHRRPSADRAIVAG